MPISGPQLATLGRLLAPAQLALLEQPTLPDQAVAPLLQELSTLLAALTPFVPSPMAEEAFSAELPPPPTLQASSGTLLVCAVDGLRRLGISAQTANETSSATIEQLFSTLTAEIVRHGGGVIKLIGDGLIACFTRTALGEQHAGLACAAALALHNHMRTYGATPSLAASLTLHLRVGLHSGPFTAVTLGDHTHAEILLTGPSIGQAQAALDAAKPGETIISEATRVAAGALSRPLLAQLHLLNGLARQPALPPSRPTWRTSGQPREMLAVTLERIAALQRYLPAGLQRRLLLDTATADLRPVTVLAVNFCDFGHRLGVVELVARSAGDPGLVAQVLNRYFLAAQGVIHEYGGAVYKVDTVAFSDRLLAAFGAPFAHEDAELRALEAARRLGPALAEADRTVAELLEAWSAERPDKARPLGLVALQLRPRVVLDTSVLFSGVVGTAERREYTLVGEAVRLAPSLLGATRPGTTMLTAATYRALREPILVAQPTTIRREAGLPEVTVFQLVPEADGAEVANLRAPLVGRRGELDALRLAARSALSDGGGRVVALRGEAGLGKTRLTEELAAALPTDAPRALAIRHTCRSYERTVPYAAIGRGLSAVLAAVAASDSPDELRAQAAVLVPAYGPQLSLLAPLIGAHEQATELVEGLSPEHRRERLHELIVALLLAVARRQPLALILDDLHWADASSRAVVAQLAVEVGAAPLLLVLPERPGDAEAPWLEQPASLVVSLEVLTADESMALVAATLGGPPPAALHADLGSIYGNPLYIEEVLAYLREQGALHQDEAGAWVYEQAEGRALVPGQLERMVLARLDHLEPAAQTAARLLAVIGQPTGLVLLQQLNRAEQAARGVEELVEVGLVAAEVGAETRYGYRHPLVAETVYESIPAALRRTLHGEVAAALEQQYGGQAGPWLAVLAEHTLRAGQQEAASRHFLTAARYAHGRYATQEAVALYRQALATTPAAEAGPAFDPALALAIREPLGEVLALSGAYDEARAQFEALIAQLERLGPQELRVERARLLRRIGTTHEQQGQLDQALEVLGRAAAVVAAAPLTTASAVEYAGIFSEIGWVNFRRGELSDAQEALERALELLQLYDAEAERAQVLNRLGGVAWQQGMLGVAQEYVAQSLAIHERRGDLLGQGHALANLGVLAEVQGLSSEARQYGERAFAAHERTGYKRFMAVAANNVAVACYDDEDFVDSVRWSTRAATTAEEIRDDYALAFAYLNQGRALVRLGIWDDAFESLTHSYNITRRFGFVTELLDTRIALIELELGRGNTETAVEQYDVLLREVSETEGQEYGRLLRLGGAMKAVQGDNVAALDLFDAAVVLFTRLRLAPEVARTERLRAQALENKEAS